MKILRKIQSKAIVLGMALFLLVFSLFSGVQFLRVSAENNSNESEIVYIDTEVEGIAYVQHPTCVFFGFRLTESDYDDFGLWETDYMGTPTYAAYEKYIATDLTYWKDFAKNNSEEVYFDQLYAYWHGSSVGPANFANTVAHRSTLERLEYGFIISIPKERRSLAQRMSMENAQVRQSCIGRRKTKPFITMGRIFLSFLMKLPNLVIRQLKNLKR